MPFKVQQPRQVPGDTQGVKERPKNSKSPRKKKKRASRALEARSRKKGEEN